MRILYFRFSRKKIAVKFPVFFLLFNQIGKLVTRHRIGKSKLGSVNGSLTKICRNLSRTQGFQSEDFQSISVRNNDDNNGIVNKYAKDKWKISRKMLQKFTRKKCKLFKSYSYYWYPFPALLFFVFFHNLLNFNVCCWGSI